MTGAGVCCASLIVALAGACMQLSTPGTCGSSRATHRSRTNTSPARSNQYSIIVGDFDHQEGRVLMTSSCRSRSPRSCSIAPPQDAAGREQLRVAASTIARSMRFTSVAVCTCLMAPHQLSSLPRTARCSASLACVAAHPEHTCGALTAPFLPLSCRLMHEQRLLTSSYATAAGEAAACSMQGHFAPRAHEQHRTLNRSRDCSQAAARPPRTP